MGLPRSLPRYLGLSLLGAALATALDYEHVQHRVLAYPHPSMGVQEWWVPLLFGVSTLALVIQARFYRRSAERMSRRELWLRVADFAMAYLVTSFARDQPLWLTAGLVVAWVPWVAREPRQWLMGVAVAVAGPVVEISLSHLGAFAYLPDQPLWLGVPIWLPALYLHVSLAARALDFLVQPGTPGGDRSAFPREVG